MSLCSIKEAWGVNQISDLRNDNYCDNEKVWYSQKSHENSALQKTHGPQASRRLRNRNVESEPQGLVANDYYDFSDLLSDKSDGEVLEKFSVQYPREDPPHPADGNAHHQFDQYINHLEHCPDCYSRLSLIFKTTQDNRGPVSNSYEHFSPLQRIKDTTSSMFGLDDEMSDIVTFIIAGIVFIFLLDLFTKMGARRAL